MIYFRNLKEDNNIDGIIDFMFEEDKNKKLKIPKGTVKEIDKNKFIKIIFYLFIFLLIILSILYFTKIF